MSNKSVRICFQKNADISSKSEVLGADVWIHDSFSLEVQNVNKNSHKSHKMLIN